MTTMSSLQLRLLRFLVKRLGEIRLHGEENSHLRVGGIVEFALLINRFAQGSASVVGSAIGRGGVAMCQSPCSCEEENSSDKNKETLCLPTTTVGGDASSRLSAVVGVHCHTSLELLDFVRKSVSSIEVAGKGGKKIAGIRQSAAMRVGSPSPSWNCSFTLGALGVAFWGEGRLLQGASYGYDCEAQLGGAEPPCAHPRVHAKKGSATIDGGRWLEAPPPPPVATLPPGSCATTFVPISELGLVGISFVEAVGKGGKEIAGIRQSAAMGVGMVGHVL
uniref:Uncharacterized protein n=1 Tax=Oryza sativa subsp. japonica TaxID=39947 RepID=Q6EQ83_ORYSJ|nr:hypothetical protein [Oryza sativa Japonica Group]